jgi:Leucine-rich repeat (LRR) protein
MNLSKYVIYDDYFKIIDLESNDLDDIEQIEYLDTLTQLESVNLNGNPIMKIKNQEVR